MLLLCLPFIASLLTILFFHPSLHQIFQFRTKGSKLPPGSLGWIPFLGQTLSFIAPHRSSALGPFLNKNIERFIISLIKHNNKKGFNSLMILFHFSYGKIFKSHIFGYPTIVSCDVEFNSFILQNEERLFHVSYPSNIQGVLGDLSLVVVTGDMHKRLRGFAINFFSSVKTPNSSFLSGIEDNVLRIMDSWKNKNTLEFISETRKFTFGVIVKQILSLEIEDPDAVEILKNFRMFMKGLASVPINLPGTTYVKAIRARHQIQKKLKKIRTQRDNGDNTNRTMDFLDVLLTLGNISDEEISSLVLDLLLGGHETSSMLIAIIAKFLGENANSNILHELREEHLSVMKTKNENGRLGWDDYKKMQFTQCVISEALRLGNVVKLVSRKAIKPIQYKGYDIPAGWKFFTILSSSHLDPSLHPDTFKFDPYRWQNVDVTTSKKFTPFGGGTRLCPGSELARLETSFFIHHLVLNYSWTPLMDSDWPMHYPYIDFKHGLQLAIKPLSPAS